MKPKLHILMIEDSPEDASLIVRDLKRDSFDVAWERVDTEGTLKNALTRGKWDAVLCDYTMPRYSGKAALQFVRSTDADLPFIYVSGTIGEDVAVEALKAGANDYILKSNLKRLVPAVERELREASLRREHKMLAADREELVVKLTSALQAVKQLSGILPICAGCRNIRNDRNEWQRLEVYIQQHSEAQFSHGLCPKCLPIYGFPFKGQSKN